MEFLSKGLADRQSVKLSKKIIVSSWMGDPMISDFFVFGFSLHRIKF